MNQKSARNVLQSIAALAVTVCDPVSCGAEDSVGVWIGTGGHTLSRGIYYSRLNTENGGLSDPVLAAQVHAPGFLAMHPDLPVLYSIGSLHDEPSVIAWAVNDASGASGLRLINSVPVGDGAATHLSIDATGRTILTAQYGGGSVATFSLNSDGSVAERTQLLKHTSGSGVVAGRQDAAHAHWAGFSPDNRFAFVPDLGLDQVVVYRFDAATSRITPHSTGTVQPGGGPRHMKFHTSGKWIYVLNELDLSIAVFDYDSEAGTMTPKQHLPTVPKEDLAKENFTSASEIRVHPSGRFVYSANRGHDTVTAFQVNEETGKLTVIEREFMRGATPRNFNLDPSGRWLLAAGQDSHTLASFAVDQDTGQLTYSRSIVFAPSPICVLFE